MSIFQGIERAGADRSSIRDRMVQSAQALAGDEDDLLASAEQITRAISNLSAVRAAAPECGSALKEALVGMTYFSNLMRIDRNGAVVCSALPYAKDLNLSAAPIFSRARQAAGFVVSGEIPSAVLHRPVVAGMLPLRDAQGNFQGALSIELDTGWLDSLMRSHARAPGAVVFIADRDRHILGSNDHAVAQALIAGASAAENSPALREAQDAAGNSWRFSEIALQGGPLFIGYAMKESALFSATYLSVATDFLMPVLMIILAWTAIWFATEQQVTRWILYLRRISAAYRGGHYSIRPSLTGAPAEFTALGQGFSDMANSIQDRDQRLRDAVELKTVLIREIHHRVKNNLQVVMSLLSLQVGRVRDPSARQALVQAQARINALVVVHRILHEIEFQPSVDLKRIISELGRQITEGMSGNNSKFVYKEDLMSVTVSGDSAIPLALFVTEVLTNSFKHAFPAGGAGTISLSLAPSGDQLHLVIADNGEGYDDTHESGGLGRRLIQSLAQQVQGQVKITTAPGQGTRIELIFKNPNRDETGSDIAA
ncbi:MAG TPA: sensor histidine kinase [Rhizomicrobium sp.]|nr:sensor histidine kinase [Rhizomicrobium sp.]